MNIFADHIPLMKPWVDEDEEREVLEVLRSGWVTQGRKVAALEAHLAGLVGARHGVATNSATSALHLGLLVAGIRPGDHVVVPSLTCMATVNAIVMAGAEPVFADVDRRTFNLDPSAVEAVLTDAVRGILLVHQVGLPADVGAFQTLARKRGLVLVEDAATAVGGKVAGRYLGGHGQPAAYSFHPRKIITTGEGGMLMLEDDSAAERARRLRSAGADISDVARHQALGTLCQTYPEPGFNYRLTDLQAAVGLAQLRKLPEILAQRAAQAVLYDRLLADVPGVLPPYVPPGTTHCYSSYCVSIPGARFESITGVLAEMAGQGVSCRRGIQPLHREPWFADRCRGLALPVTDLVAAETLFLPIFPGLTAGQQEHVVRALTAAVRRHVGGGAGGRAA